MAKVKVKVLYPTAFVAMGIDVEGSATVSIEESDAETLIGNGWAEAETAARTSPAAKARKKA